MAVVVLALCLSQRHCPFRCWPNASSASDSVSSVPRSCTLAALVDFKAQSFALGPAGFALIVDLSRLPRRPIFSNNYSSTVFFPALLLPFG